MKTSYKRFAQFGLSKQINKNQKTNFITKGGAFLPLLLSTVLRG
jgi:hypothetical protein